MFPFVCSDHESFAISGNNSVYVVEKYQQKIKGLSRYRAFQLKEKETCKWVLSCGTEIDATLQTSIMFLKCFLVVLTSLFTI